MRCWKSALVIVAGLIAGAPASCLAGFVITSGTEQVIPQPFFPQFQPLPPPNATWTGVLGTIAGETTGSTNDLGLGGPLNTPTADIVLEVTKPQEFAGTYAGAQIGPIPKFSGNPRRGAMAIGTLSVTDGKDPDRTQAEAETSFTSNAAFAVLPDRASLTGKAKVAQATGQSPAGIAFASSEDPWVFVPDTSSALQLTITLQDVSLVASATNGESAIGMIHAFGAFGFDSADGFQVLASWDFLREVSGNDSFSLSSMTLTDQISGTPLDGSGTFPLSPGVTYELNADLVLGARVDPVPEPATATLFGLGTLALMGYARRRGWTAQSRPASREATRSRAGRSGRPEGDPGRGPCPP